MEKYVRVNEETDVETGVPIQCNARTSLHKCPVSL